ncbi:hypothetical protein SMSP2_02612 [Limihaloglobus sulfuriphilus]|uniref:Ice-binding protein C-terminal domain-containing protein n=1 Tax=Limihaloglobus sulfuriphilus TaxID=1851148 RepID=A0A1Q2MHQ9_9BACT|nr:PEP-CTERM sorting domain-containing protein [Limihaloglobus sulfuriphilus]AQQ72231.1 hypothetical protein SMSP2_02612 [Limihaloglobus sulfuriphilus]
MKKCSVFVLVLAFGVASLASADYVNFLGQPDGSGGRYAGVGAIDMAGNWEGGAVPYGSDTGLITQANNVWTPPALYNIAVRLEGGQIKSPSGLAMRGGLSGSGVTTLIEIDTSDWQTVVNLNVSTELVFWSQYKENMELNILNGSVETPDFRAPSALKGTVSMGNGVFHAAQASGSVNYKMLAGGTGEIIIDAIPATGFGLTLDFASSNAGSLTLGEKGGGTTGGVWAWYIDNGKVSIDGVVNTNRAAYNITEDGFATTISLVPEPATMMILGLGSLLIRRKS